MKSCRRNKSRRKKMALKIIITDFLLATLSPRRYGFSRVFAAERRTPSVGQSWWGLLAAGGGEGVNTLFYYGLGSVIFSNVFRSVRRGAKKLSWYIVNFNLRRRPLSRRFAVQPHPRHPSYLSTLLHFSFSLVFFSGFFSVGCVYRIGPCVYVCSFNFP